MPKTISSDLKAHLAGQATTVATCWLITRTDNVVLAFTDHDQDIVVDGVTYQAALSYSRSAIRGASSLQSESVQIDGILDSSTITENDLRSGVYDSADVKVFLVNWADLTQGILKLRAGKLGKVVMGKYGFQTDVLGISDPLQYRIGDVYQGTCRADLGDAKCGINLTALGVNDTVASVPANQNSQFVATGLTQDGPKIVTYTASTISFKKTRRMLDSANGLISAGFAVNDAMEILGSAYNDGTHTVRNLAAGSCDFDLQASDIVTENAGNPITLSVTTLGYFDLGYVLWLTGANAGRKMEIKAWSGPSTKTVTLFLPMYYAIAAGDTYTIFPGCDKRINTCFAKFSNVINFRGENLAPGENNNAEYPNAR